MTIILAFISLLLAGCAADRYDVMENQVIVERVSINHVSQDTMTLEFRTPTGLFVRRLICDKWDQQCIVWK